jgi:TRAP-type C4-dicarboxylate transport system substrate-binding protein
MTAASAFHSACRRTRRGLIAGAAAALVLPGLAVAQEKVTLRVASFMPPQGFLDKVIVIPFLDKVVADSKGTLEYKWFPGGTLGRAPAEQLALVQNGVADIATFPANDQERVKGVFQTVVADWVKAEPGRDKLLEALRKGVADIK